MLALKVNIENPFCGFEDVHRTNEQMTNDKNTLPFVIALH